MSIFLLTDQQKDELLQLSQVAPELLAHRARLILAYAEGKPTMQAAREAGISRGRARYWKRQFLAQGMHIFTQEKAEEPAQNLKISISAEKLDKPFNGDTDKYNVIEDGTLLTIPYPKPLLSIGIQADDTLAEAGRKVWLYHFALMISHQEGTLEGNDQEQLHDMRVATRRMRSAFDIFSPAFDPKVMKRYLKGLRKIGNVLGKVRDMDVILDNALKYQQNFSEDKQQGFEPLLVGWRRTIEKRRLKMAKHLQSKAYQNFTYNFNLFLQQPDAPRVSITSEDGKNSHLRDMVPILMYSRFAAVRAYAAVIPTASMSQLHALRIDIKRFRYALEYFREILGDNAQQIISELKQMQDHLGELHDAVVACDLVRSFFVGWEDQQAGIPISDRLNPEPIATYLAYLYSERYRLTTSFPRLWRNFNRPEFRQNIAQAISLL